MSKTKEVFIMAILSLVWLSGAGRAQANNAMRRATEHEVERILLINMSGKAREACVGDAEVPLPVAERVVLQIYPGERITITSSTNRAIHRVMAPAATDSGRVIVVN